MGLVMWYIVGTKSVCLFWYGLYLLWTCPTDMGLLLRFIMEANCLSTLTWASLCAVLWKLTGHIDMDLDLGSILGKEAIWLPLYGFGNMTYWGSRLTTLRWFWEYELLRHISDWPHSCGFVLWFIVRKQLSNPDMVLIMWSIVGNILTTLKNGFGYMIHYCGKRYSLSTLIWF